MFEKSNLWFKFRNSVYFKISIAIVIIYLIILIIDKFVMPAYVHLGDEAELPDVVEMSLEEAKATLEKQKFVPIVVDSTYDENLSAGFVVEQSPYPFTRVKKGRKVYLTVCLGKKPILMPNLFYKSTREAEEIIKSYGLELRSKYYEYNDIAVDGVVIGQSYPQGQQIKKGTGITITISLGPFPVEKTIPDLVGSSLVSAKKQLQAIGIKNIKVEYEVRENMLPETVLSQSLKSGTKVSEDMEITLKISKL
ncbi:MAG: PASTA domain-containing protein [Calditrichaceae bacterium]|nr:PASTA domain-containing protein [Calditrichaceae bacterium]MBN2709930.1 PASTA domain-containing protein [Calditrichaceae bacterium]RQV92680.1 MAG: PASTA domain-containing protein [Calditrichota bacterium]